MKTLISWLLLRPLLEAPMRLVACLVVGLALLSVPELVLGGWLHGDVPRGAAAALLVILGLAWLFLRASWRRARGRQRSGAERVPARSFTLGIVVSRGAGESFLRAAVVLDRPRKTAP